VPFRVTFKGYVKLHTLRVSDLDRLSKSFLRVALEVDVAFI